MRVRHTAAYVLVWLVGAAALAGLAILLLDDGEPETVSLPPIQETELTKAVDEAGCALRRTKSPERTDPPVDGPAAPRPARAGFYEHPPEAAELVAALRHGVIVIHFRRDLDPDRVEELRSIQESAPNATIVTPNATMSFEVAATAFRRLLGCSRWSDASIDATRLFRGRFLGSGPDP
jgi:hypothetical protein